MVEVTPVAVLVGSLREGSYTRQVAKAVVGLAPASLACRFVEIGDLPLYNADLEAEPPQAWTRFRDELRTVRAVLFATPEYNRSVPGVLKNAIDVGSRPSRQGAINGKPCAILSVSPGKIGAFGANQHLRQSLVFLDMPTMQQPEAYVGGADKLFDAEGRFASDDTRKFLQGFIEAFARWAQLLETRTA